MIFLSLHRMITEALSYWRTKNQPQMTLKAVFHSCFAFDFQYKIRFQKSQLWFSTIKFCAQDRKVCQSTTVYSIIILYHISRDFKFCHHNHSHLHFHHWNPRTTTFHRRDLQHRQFSLETFCPWSTASIHKCTSASTNNCSKHPTPTAPSIRPATKFLPKSSHVGKFLWKTWFPCFDFGSRKRFGGEWTNCGSRAISVVKVGTNLQLNISKVVNVF